MNSKNGQGEGSALFVESDIATWGEDDYRRLLSEIEPLFLADEGTTDAERADVLFDCIEAYEQSHYRIAEWLQNAPPASENTPKRKPHDKLPSDREAEVADLVAA